MKEVLDALKFLFSNGIINEVQFQDFYNRCNTPGVDIESLKNELKKIYDDFESKNSSIDKSKVNDSIDDIEIIDVDDGEIQTGIFPINSFRDNLNEYEEIGENESGQSKGIQKTLGAHPSAGSHFHWGDDGFTTLMLIMFLTGISVGIISMIVLNFIA